MSNQAPNSHEELDEEMKARARQKRILQESRKDPDACDAAMKEWAAFCDGPVLNPEGDTVYCGRTVFPIQFEPLSQSDNTAPPRESNGSGRSD